MEKQEFDKLFTQITKDVQKNIKQRAEELWKSGALDTGSYPNDLTLPRIVMTDCLLNAAGIQRHYLSRKSFLAALANLKHF
ncbi:MAG: hypothetical protein WC455_13320 [Dehalococcoidia bacterium]|jgi:hypothetical protein